MPSTLYADISSSLYASVFSAAASVAASVASSAYAIPEIILTASAALIAAAIIFFIVKPPLSYIVCILYSGSASYRTGPSVFLLSSQSLLLNRSVFYQYFSVQVRSCQGLHTGMHGLLPEYFPVRDALSSKRSLQTSLPLCMPAGFRYHRRLST